VAFEASPERVLELVAPVPVMASGSVPSGRPRFHDENAAVVDARPEGRQPPQVRPVTARAGPRQLHAHVLLTRQAL
jgi:hypothetical protein